MTTIKSLAERVQNDLEHKQQVFLDPASIMMMIAITEAVIKLIKGCRDAKKAKEAKELQEQQAQVDPLDVLVPGNPLDLIDRELVMMTRFPSEREKRRLHRVVRREVGFKKYREDGDKYVAAILNTGQGVTAQELQDSFKELDGKTTV